MTSAGFTPRAPQPATLWHSSLPPLPGRPTPASAQPLGHAEPGCVEAAPRASAPGCRARLYALAGSRRGRSPGERLVPARGPGRRRRGSVQRTPPAASPANGASRTTCPPGRSRPAVCSPSLSPLAGVQPGRRPAGERLRSGASSAVTRAPTCRGGAWVQSIWVMGPFRKVPRDPGVGCVGPPPRPGP